MFLLFIFFYFEKKNQNICIYRVDTRLEIIHSCSSYGIELFVKMIVFFFRVFAQMIVMITTKITFMPDNSSFSEWKQVNRYNLPINRSLPDVSFFNNFVVMETRRIRQLCRGYINLNDPELSTATTPKGKVLLVIAIPVIYYEY